MENIKVEIYKITNTITNKSYVGQTVSHVLNHGKYRPYGSNKRFNAHVSEAFSKKKNQCHYLNASIRKHGTDAFVVNVLEICDITESDECELKAIQEHNTLYPNGYNLKLGGTQFRHSDESKKRLSIGVKRYFEDKKMERFANVNLQDINIDTCIRPLTKYGNQYGWYVYIDKKKADFGGIHIPLEKSKNDAIEFVNKLINNAKHLVVQENPESSNYHS